MASTIMFDAVEPYACETVCDHLDCTEMKHFVKNAKCKICENKIEVGQSHYGSKLGELSHWLCEHEQADKKRLEK